MERRSGCAGLVLMGPCIQRDTALQLQPAVPDRSKHCSQAVHANQSTDPSAAGGLLALTQAAARALTSCSHSCWHSWPAAVCLVLLLPSAAWCCTPPPTSPKCASELALGGPLGSRMPAAVFCVCRHSIRHIADMKGWRRERKGGKAKGCHSSATMPHYGRPQLQTLPAEFV